MCSSLTFIESSLHTVGSIVHARNKKVRPCMCMVTYKRLKYWKIIKPAQNLFTRGSNDRTFLCQIWCFALVAALTWRIYCIPLNE